MVYREGQQWQIQVSQPVSKQPLYLNTLNYDNLMALQRSVDRQEGPLIVAIDCVMGLPTGVPCNPHWGQGRSMLLQLFLEAAHHQNQLKLRGDAPYGMEASRSFFRKLYPDGAQDQKRPPRPPQRWVENLLRANSVFRERPFQKNIQSGTYRIWADLGESSHLDRLHFWPFDHVARCQAGECVFVECYPSHLWRVDWDIARRNPENLISKLDQADRPLRLSPQDRQVLLSSPDHCDALVNALGYINRWESNPIEPPYPDARRVLEKEGWILGAEVPEKSVGTSCQWDAPLVSCRG
jgi:hypothetical protein